MDVVINGRKFVPEDGCATWKDIAAAKQRLLDDARCSEADMRAALEDLKADFDALVLRNAELEEQHDELVRGIAAARGPLPNDGIFE